VPGGLHTLAAGIDRDREAVIAGLTLPWNSGVVEGHVNRIRMLKRRMSRAWATVGEVCDALREVWGTYVPTDAF
jgi:hypothetical protein